GDQVSVRMEMLPPEVCRLVVAASADRVGGVGFGMPSGLRLNVADEAGRDVLRFDIADADQQQTVVLGELYRDGGLWRFRAIGKGHDTSLTGLAARFGLIPGGLTV